MTKNKIVGLSCVAAPFAGLFILASVMSGLGTALCIFVPLCVAAALIWIGVNLMIKDKP